MSNVSMPYEDAFTTSSIYREFSERLKQRTAETPAHLLREEDIREALRNVLLRTSPAYHDVRRYMAEHERVDVRLMHGDVTVLIEFKLWHSTLKLVNQCVVSRSQPAGDRLKHEKDLRDLANSSYEHPVQRYFMFLTQTSRHPQAPAKAATPGPWGPWDPGSSLQPMYELARQGDQATIQINDDEREQLIDVQVRLDERWKTKSGGAPDWQCDMEFRAIRVLP
jgi:hypothetical protein